MTRSIVLYLFVCFVAVVRAAAMPFVLPFRAADYRTRYYLAEDQAWNVVLNGHPDETISARAHRTNSPRLERFVNWLFNDKNHCANAYHSEKTGAQNATEYRK